MSKMELPEATHESVVTIGGFSLRVFHLDDGKRVIHKDDYDQLLAAMQTGAFCPAPEDYTRLSEALNGKPN